MVRQPVPSLCSPIQPSGLYQILGWRCSLHLASTHTLPYLLPRHFLTISLIHSHELVLQVRFQYAGFPASAVTPSFPRKEVIQPHLPVRLPCYDFVPVIRPTLGSSSLAVRSPTSGVSNSHDVTGGVYKARERIHRSIADLRLLATPASCRRVAACNLNYERL